jgi:hypothetical protein
MWEPRRLTNLWVCTACYRDSWPISVYCWHLIKSLKLQRKSKFYVGGPCDGPKFWRWNFVFRRQAIMEKQTPKMNKILLGGASEGPIRAHICTNIHTCKHTAFQTQIFVVSSTKILRGLSRQANYTDRATAACRRSYCQLLQIEGVAWSAQWILTAVFSVF